MSAATISQNQFIAALCGFNPPEGIMGVATTLTRASAVWVHCFNPPEGIMGAATVPAAADGKPASEFQSP